MKLKLTGIVNSNSVIVSEKLINNEIIHTTGILIILFLTVISIEDGNDTFNRKLKTMRRTTKGNLARVRNYLALGLGQTSLFSCTEPNVNEKSLF